MPTATPPPLVIFDLDGTLIDTGPDLVSSLNHTIAQVGLEPVRFDDLNHLVGQGARTMIARAFALRGAPTTPEQNEKLHDVFLKHYLENMPGESKPFPGLIDAMAALDEAAFAMAVCTNKTEALSVQLLEALGLASRFKAVVGGDSLPYRKPDGRHIHGTIDKAGGHARTAVMVGDSVNDIEAAKDAGIVSIGVPFGYSDVPITELQPTHVLEHFDELTPQLVLDLLAEKVR